VAVLAQSGGVCNHRHGVVTQVDTDRLSVVHEADETFLAGCFEGNRGVLFFRGRDKFDVLLQLGEELVLLLDLVVLLNDFVSKFFVWLSTIVLGREGLQLGGLVVVDLAKGIEDISNDLRGDVSCINTELEQELHSVASQRNA
jgi:hypothetical protein